ncbi:hypothetical protein Hanom_Chr08g00747671 [Helianthus anomalus]
MQFCTSLLKIGRSFKHILKSKLEKSFFMYVNYCKLCSLSSIITENILNVCKTLQIMFFSPNSVNFCG